MSTPSVGRIVHYYTRNPDHQSHGVGIGPYAAIITETFTVEDGTVAPLVNLKVSPPGADDYRAGAVHGDGADMALADLTSWWVWPPRA